ncbi:MAG: hypothetical protein UY05_C0054G0005 [Candidatus Peregrinibacteria bacterium GW2011_GWA2_47_7]|nr:MAG: hypothetical protein UY05_C0054G0005 [Candidatus Peregrinibacteria bacterium GW2011_GWA2_47_7]OGJ42529.1 MAG: hypothetical protein A2974_03025 [Candidatus Peregrinibacteria bacterium RIFCSPLOWO2_01_FULL_48_20]
MNVVKVTTSGQITIPAEIRSKFKTQIFSCEFTEEGFLFRPVEVNQAKPKKYKYKMADLKKWKIHKSKCPDEHNLAGKIDKIIYTL